MDIQKLLPGVKENILLKEHTTFRIGGPAKYFFVAKIKEDLIKAIKVAKKINLPFFVLGGGSNLLISDKGFKGLVIKMKNEKLKVKSNKIFCDAGVFLSTIVNKTAKLGLTGLEWATGIPGTVGGAIRGNAGAFGKSMKNVVKNVEVFNSKELRIKNYELRNCKFGYRDSVFKKNSNLVILSAVLKFNKGNKKDISKKIKEYSNYRFKNQPLNFPSAGSIFKNPLPVEISKKFKRASGFSAGELIEKCGLKGKRVGDVKISEKHANFIVNLGSGRAKDVIKLINLAKKKVKNKFGITLNEEIQILGQF